MNSGVCFQSFIKWIHSGHWNTHRTSFCTHVIHGGVEDYTDLCSWSMAHMATNDCRSCLSMYSKIYDQSLPCPLRTKPIIQNILVLSHSSSILPCLLPSPSLNPSSVQSALFVRTFWLLFSSQLPSLLHCPYTTYPPF